MQPSIVALAKQKAQDYGLDPTLVCAVIEQESGGDPWAIRFEPAFYEKYVASMGLNPTEAYSRSFSFGLMQVMGEVAREVGFKGKWLSALCDPETGIDVGCRVLKLKLQKAKGDVARGLQFWNGGGNPDYASQVMARMGNYA